MRKMSHYANINGILYNILLSNRGLITVDVYGQG